MWIDVDISNLIKKTLWLYLTYVKCEILSSLGVYLVMWLGVAQLFNWSSLSLSLFCLPRNVMLCFSHIFWNRCGCNVVTTSEMLETCDPCAEFKRKKEAANACKAREA